MRDGPWCASLVGLTLCSFARFASAQAEPPVSADGPEAAPPTSQPDTAAPSPASPEPAAPAQAPERATIAPTPAAPAKATPSGEASPWISPKWPRTLPYYGGAPTPPGYQLQSRFRWGLIVPGAVLFSFGYALAIAATFDENYEGSYWLYVPVVGPQAAVIVGWSRCTPDDGDSSCDLGDVIEQAPLEFLSLLFQAPGAAFMLAGFTPQKRFVRNDLASLSVTPVALRGGMGIRAFGEF